MRTDVACDKLCDIAPYISALAMKSKTNVELKEALLSGVKSNDTTEQIKFFAKLIKQSKYEVLSILGVWFEKSYEEIAAQDFFKETLPMLKQLWKDADVKSFFTSFTVTDTAEQTAEEKAVEELSLTSENTAVETEAEDVMSNRYVNI